MVDKTAEKTKKKERPITQPSSPSKRFKADPANLVPTEALQVKLPEVEGGTSGDITDPASASTRGKDMGIAKPWGVETPEIAPQLPADDASPTPIEVQKCVKAVAAYVVTTLPTFFKDNSK